MLRILTIPLLISALSSVALSQLFNPQQQGGFNPPPQMPNPGPGIGSNNPFVSPNNYYFNMGPLLPFGPGTRDIKLMDREAQTGRQVDLFTWFPYYGGKYNYTVLSVHGYVAFANILEDGLDFLIGEDVPNWPQNPDPAMIAVYTCRQKQSSAVPADQTGVYYRLVFRRDMAVTTNINQVLNNYQKRADYIDFNGDDFLDQVQYNLAQGMVGAKSFRPDAALVVTWQNMSYYQASSPDEMQKTATYQMVFATDRAGQLGYTMINYHSLGFAGGDIYGNMKRGRCKAELNGGNQTGLILVDPVYSKYPNKLYQMSSVPHVVGGRYLFRVDDIIRKGGCSNLTAGTYRLTIYPDIINMLGDVPIQVNGPCYQPNSNNPTLNIANYKPSQCIIKNPAIAECRMNQFYNWGTKNVYLEYNNNKAYVGSIYYVPVGLDPFGLSVDSIADWFKNPPPRTLTVRWYPGNFTDINNQIISTLELTLYGYRESNDPTSQKYTNVLTPLCVIAQVQNQAPNQIGGVNYGLLQQASYQITVPLNPQWIGNGQSNMWAYSFGVLKLGVPVTSGTSNLSPAQQGQGIWSPPVPLQWLWLGTSGAQSQNPEDQRNYIASIAQKACINWFEEEGTQWNFIQDTETNASCPCTLDQAYADLGRFMPHPRCSQRFRQVGCDTFIGAKECFLSAQNVISKFATHYGQVCCYDANGFLMQTTYASVQPDIIKGADRDPLPFNPGFPQRAYELGTYTYYKQYEAPALSNYFHDVMPYYFCCKWSQNHCQFFYWRRPSSGCQEYRPAGISSVYGAGHFTTFDNVQYTFEGNGTYVLLHKNAQLNVKNPTPSLLVEIRMERYPNRMVDFSHRNTYQYELMQPVNASVVTGVAVQEENSDRVVVMARKDTRRMKYRTNVLVNDEIRYFDTMKLQRFEGFIMYINDVMEGQSEVYITLLASRIGLRIRESYAYHIYQQQTFEESFGVLDVTVSIPSEYFVKPDPINNQMDWQHAVEGLVGTYSNNTQDEFTDPKTGMPQGGYSNDQQAAQWAKTWVVDGVMFQNLFTLMKAEHKEWPESMLLNPIYKPAPEMEQDDPFYPQYDQDVTQRIEYCMNYPSQNNCPAPAFMKDILPTCYSQKWCIYDYFFLQQKILAQLLQSEYNSGKGLRQEMYAPRNSCAAINIQYPEYLYIEPARGGYLGGDNVLFQCYQNGWLKGDAAYQCRDGQWNKGWQPWCRSRSLENTLRIVSIIFGILLVVAFLAAVFLCCFCFSKSRREKSNLYQTGEPLPKKDLPVNEPKSMIVTSEPNGYTKYTIPAPAYEPKSYEPKSFESTRIDPPFDAHLRVQMVNGSDSGSPSSGRGGNVTSV